MTKFGTTSYFNPHSLITHTKWLDGANWIFLQKSSGKIHKKYQNLEILVQTKYSRMDQVKFVEEPL